MTRTRYHHSAPRPAALWVRLFGPVELSNQWGAVSENPGRRSLPWLLLKYLLANAGREVDSGELERALWPGRAETENNLRVRLHRLREALAPLGLDGPEGLVLYCAGRFALNPDIPIQTDGERFSALLRREGRAAPEDRDGLTACGQALELYRGPFLEYTAPPPGWRATGPSMPASSAPWPGTPCAASSPLGTTGCWSCCAAGQRGLPQGIRSSRTG